MTRGLAAHLNTYDGVKATGSVRGGATVELLTHVVLLAGTNNVGNSESVDIIRAKTRTLFQTTRSAFPAASLIFSGIHHRVDMPHSTTYLKIDKINNDLRVLCDQQNINFVDNNVESTHQAPDTYRLNNHDGLHLNIHGRRQLCERLANLILPGSHVFTRPTPARHVSAPLIQQVYRHRHQPRTVPRPFIAQQRPQQPSHRPESYQHTHPAPTQHRSNQANTPQQQTYASVLSDPAPSHCVHPTPFLPSRLVIRDKMSVCPTQPLQIIPQQQNNLVSVQAMLAAALQQATMTQTMW